MPPDQLIDIIAHTTGYNANSYRFIDIGCDPLMFLAGQLRVSHWTFYRYVKAMTHAFNLDCTIVDMVIVVHQISAMPKRFWHMIGAWSNSESDNIELHYIHGNISMFRMYQVPFVIASVRRGLAGMGIAYEFVLRIADKKVE